MLADARPLRISAGHFGKCLSGDADVDVALFIAACQNYCKVLALIGPFTLLSTREVISNMKKIEHSFELAPVRYRSMRELLEAEVAAGMHQPGGVLSLSLPPSLLSTRAQRSACYGRGGVSRFGCTFSAS